MSRPIKEMLISEISEQLGEPRDMLVIDSSRLDAITANKFRLALQERNIHALTVKNSLALQALHRMGVEALDPILEGPSTLVWGGEDIVALSKEMAQWAKELAELEIKGGAVEGETLDAGAVDALSKSPSREELIGMIAGQALGPGGRLAGQLLGPGGTIAGQLKTKSEEDE